MTFSTVESPGKRLHDKRLEKQWSVADAARITHIRPDRIIDLEKDDYSNFPSLAYARGFLLIYARELGIDVSEAAVQLENSNPVDIEEYEYLSGRPAPLTRSLGVGRKVTAVVVVLLALMAGAALILWHLVNYFNRIDLVALTQKDQQAAHATPTPAPVETPTPVPEAPKAEASPAVGEPAPSVPGNNEIVLRPLKKSWVKVQKGGDDTTPVYEDWLYPDANGLTLRGGKFWIQLSDAEAVEIRKNGQIVPYNSPGIVVQ